MAPSEVRISSVGLENMVGACVFSVRLRDAILGYDDFFREKFTLQKNDINEPYEHNPTVQKLWAYAVCNEYWNEEKKKKANLAW